MYRSTYYPSYLTFLLQAYRSTYYLSPLPPISTNDFFKDGRLEVSPSTYKCTGPPRSQPTTSLRTVVLKYLRPHTNVPVHHLPLIPHLSDFNQRLLLRTAVLKYLRPPASVPVHLLPLIPHVPPTSVRVYLLPFTSPSRSQPTTSLRTVVLTYLRPPTTPYT